MDNFLRSASGDEGGDSRNGSGSKFRKSHVFSSLFPCFLGSDVWVFKSLILTNVTHFG